MVETVNLVQGDDIHVANIGNDRILTVHDDGYEVLTETKVELCSSVEIHKILTKGTDVRLLSNEMSYY